MEKIFDFNYYGTEIPIWKKLPEEIVGMNRIPEERDGSFTNGYIYMIRNRINGRIYIGKTKNLKRRKSQHTEKLIALEHDNGEMLIDFFIFGAENFTFSVVSCCRDDVLLEQTEENYIRLFKSEYPNGYNSPMGKGVRESYYSRDTIDPKAMSRLSKQKELEEERMIGSKSRISDYNFLVASRNFISKLNEAIVYDWADDDPRVDFDYYPETKSQYKSMIIYSSKDNIPEIESKNFSSDKEIFDKKYDNNKDEIFREVYLKVGKNIRENFDDGILKDGRRWRYTEEGFLYDKLFPKNGDFFFLEKTKSYLVQL